MENEKLQRTDEAVSEVTEDAAEETAEEPVSETDVETDIETEAETEAETKAETVTETADAEETPAEKPGKKKPFLSEKRLEVLVAVSLGITAILMAWATWIGALHGGNQATNYARSNNLAAEGNAEYNVAAQLLISDMITWNSIMDYEFDATLAEMEGNTEEVDLINQKIKKLMTDNCSQNMLDAIIWAGDQSVEVSPFSKEGYIDSYFEKCNALLAESRECLEQGQKDNANGDKYGLVSVIYSVVLFLLGIVGIFKRLPNRRFIYFVSLALLVIGIIYMVSIPLPTNFSFGDYV